MKWRRCFAQRPEAESEGRLFDVDADLRRLAAIQAAVAGRASLRLDANQAFSEAEGRTFASALDPAGIELFEQPCDKADWAANAAVAAVSRVPIMLDESIYNLVRHRPRRRLAGRRLREVETEEARRHKSGDRRVGARACARNGTLGDGVMTDIGGWLEGCIARTTIRNAGEMNGYLKLTTPLFTPGCCLS